MRPRLLLGIVGIVIFTSLLMLNFGDSISSYIGFEQAADEGRVAHVVGSWEKDKPASFSMETKSFSFYMKDDYGTTRKVIYAKAKPSNFDEADKIVVIGEMKGEVFYANDMLLKCPSKYNDANAAQFEPAEAGL